jgi:hypothetical protein
MQIPTMAPIRAVTPQMTCSPIMPINAEKNENR